MHRRAQAFSFAYLSFDMTIFEDDELTQGQRLVWFALRELAHNNVAPNNCTRIADHMNSSRAYVSRALQTLHALSWIERDGQLIHVFEEVSLRDQETQDRDSHTRDRDCESRDCESHKGFPLSSLRFSPKKVHSTPFSPSQLTPSQSRVSAAEAPLPPWVERLVENLAWEAKPLPDDHPALWDYHPGDWRWEAGNYILRELWGDQRLPSRLNRRLEEGDVRPGKVASKWADTFRLLVEQDGYTREVIRHTVQWLFQVDEWWIESGNFQSASNSALRSRDQDGTHKFDKLVQRARSHYEQQKRQQTNPAEVRQGWDDAIEEYEQNHASDTSGDAIPSEPEVGGAAV
jgi:hypothetical protein